MCSGVNLLLTVLTGIQGFCFHHGQHGVRESMVCRTHSCSPGYNQLCLTLPKWCIVLQTLKSQSGHIQSARKLSKALVLLLFIPSLSKEITILLWYSFCDTSLKILTSVFKKLTNAIPEYRRKSHWKWVFLCSMLYSIAHSKIMWKPTHYRERIKREDTEEALRQQSSGKNNMPFAMEGCTLKVSHSLCTEQIRACSEGGKPPFS